MDNWQKNIIQLYGTRGEQWISDLPELITNIQTVYGLSNLKPVVNLSYNYVLAGFQGVKPIIVKLSFNIDDVEQEIVALNAFSGFGVIKILAKNNNMIFLERAIPGYSLKTYFPEKDAESISIMYQCLKQLHQAPLPEISVFPQVKDWLGALDKDWDIPTPYLQKARTLRDNLLATSAAPVLLHGDLHHDNILKNNDDWIVIDPKGVIGEPAYDVATFIRNPMPELLAMDDPIKMIRQRILSFSTALALPCQRIIDWFFVQTVLAWVWALEDNCDTNYFRRITEISYQLQSY